MGTCGAWLLPGAWAHPAHTWHLGSAFGMGTPQRTRGPWPLTFGWRQVELWSWLRTQGEWVGRQDMINGYSGRTQFYWVLYEDSIFMDTKIQNIIIIIIINKIINKFERNYYYLYYNFLWYFL